MRRAADLVSDPDRVSTLIFFPGNVQTARSNYKDIRHFHNRDMFEIP